MIFKMTKNITRSQGGKSITFKGVTFKLTFEFSAETMGATKTVE